MGQLKTCLGDRLDREVIKPDECEPGLRADGNAGDLIRLDRGTPVDGWTGSAPSAPSPWWCSSPAHFDQLQAERLDAGQYAVERGLIGQAAGQHGIAAVVESGEVRKGCAQPISQDPADPDLEVVRQVGIGR